MVNVYNELQDDEMIKSILNNDIKTHIQLCRYTANKVTQIIYYCIPNGDFNNDYILSECLSRTEFELTNGCQDWVLLSKSILTTEQYDKLLDILKW
jgi:hypothetical protein